MKRQNKKKTPVFITVITIFIALILVVAAIILFTRQLERQKFLGLDGRMEKLSQELNTIDPSLKWTYERGCNAYGTFGDQANCKTRIHSEQTITSNKDFLRLYKKYRDNLAGNNNLSVVSSDPDVQTADHSKVIVAMQGTRLQDKQSKNICNFTALVDGKDSRLRFDSEITNQPAELTMAFTCEEHTTDFWYPRIDSLSSPSPALF